ncbi:MAG: HIT domain-containing protein [bacterium]|nr:HIT domain-containing protein [bacterium]
MNSSVFRKDIVSGDWILVATSIKKKPTFFAKKLRPTISKRGCPFENLSSRFVEVIPNKFPVLTPHQACPPAFQEGPYQKMGGVGFQELVITRDHNRSLGFMKAEEIWSIINAYQKRYLAFKSEKCVQYILIFHNNGPSAGATVPHPHSQILALPIIPPDVGRSLLGSKRYFHKHQRCVHCDILKKEIKDQARIIYKNKDFVVLCPYASRVSFEIRLFPLKHNPNFENFTEVQGKSLAEAMRTTFAKLKNAMNDPDYNFFIHTAPAKERHTRHYHWHIEILPRTAIWGGVELGTGIEIIKMPPEEAARILKKAKA